MKIEDITFVHNYPVYYGVSLEDAELQEIMDSVDDLYKCLQEMFTQLYVGLKPVIENIEKLREPMDKYLETRRGRGDK